MKQKVGLGIPENTRKETDPEYQQQQHDAETSRTSSNSMFNRMIDGSSTHSQRLNTKYHHQHHATTPPTMPFFMAATCVTFLVVVGAVSMHLLHMGHHRHTKALESKHRNKKLRKQKIDEVIADELLPASVRSEKKRSSCTTSNYYPYADSTLLQQQQHHRHSKITSSNNNTSTRDLGPPPAATTNNNSNVTLHQQPKHHNHRIECPTIHQLHQLVRNNHNATF